MLRFCIGLLFFLTSTGLLQAQQYSMSLGVFTGITSTYTADNGIDADPRYKGRYEVKFAPIGINFGMDYERFGFMISPGLTNIGQNFYVVNTSGGQDGLRKINLQYLNVPAAFKIHIFDMSFFRFSGLVSVSAAYLVGGEETISHSATKLTFPKDVYPVLPPDYVVEYDGVKVPAVTDYVITPKEDFKPMQFFVAAGFRSDWDVSNTWRVSFDFRINYGINDPRSAAYLEKLDAHETLYDIPGTRHDMFAQLTVGISRYIDFDKNDVQRKKNLKGSGRYTPKKYPGQKVRSSRPRG